MPSPQGDAATGPGFPAGWEREEYGRERSKLGLAGLSCVLGAWGAGGLGSITPKGVGVLNEGGLSLVSWLGEVPRHLCPDEVWWL